MLGTVSRNSFVSFSIESTFRELSCKQPTSLSLLTGQRLVFFFKIGLLNDHFDLSYFKTESVDKFIHAYMLLSVK